MNLHIPNSIIQNALNLDSLIFQLLPICDRYQFFGYAAGVSPHNLDKIVSSSKSSYHGLKQVCDMWLKIHQSNNSTPTWHSVAEILAKLGEQKLSEDILQLQINGMSSFCN